MAVQAARDLDLHVNVLPKLWLSRRPIPGSMYPEHGQLKHESQALERLRREKAKLKAERDIQK